MAVQSNQYRDVKVVVVGERAHVRAKVAIDQAVGHLQRAWELLDGASYKRAAVRRQIDRAHEALTGKPVETP
jgi:hypothetical protein